jgi:hypothetical protein
MTGDLLAFVQASFRSVWSLELLLALYREPERSWSRADLVAELRSSEAVVSQSVDSLMAAGLIVLGEDGSVAYRPAGREEDALIAELADVYRRKPSTVRRAIVQSSSDKLQTFADAFKVRKGPQ